jgi:hypothetical protein
MAAYIHGARVNVRYNGAIVGEMSEFSVTRETPVADVEPLGQYDPKELVTLSRRVRWEGMAFRLSEESLTSVGLNPRSLTPDDLVGNPATQLEIIDPRDGLILERLRSVKIESNNRNYRKGELSMERVSGRALIAVDEFEN